MKNNILKWKIVDLISQSILMVLFFSHLAFFKDNGIFDLVIFILFVINQLMSYALHLIYLPKYKEFAHRKVYRKILIIHHILIIPSVLLLFYPLILTCFILCYLYYFITIYEVVAFRSHIKFRRNINPNYPTLFYSDSLENHFLLYDKDCPLCCWYTDFLIKIKVLKVENRMPYQDVDREKYNTVNYVLAQNKIALLNTNNGSVIYGIDALGVLLNVYLPFVSLFLSFKPFHWLVDKLYLFISMNRKVIMPVSCSENASCNPTRDWFWRIFFAGICFYLSINPISYFLQSDFFLCYNYIADNYVAYYLFILVAIQFITISFLNELNLYEYIGQLAFLTFIGAIALFIFTKINYILSYFNIDNQMIGIIELLVVMSWMFFEHKRRIKILDIKKELNYTWLIYHVGFTFLLNQFLMV